MGTQETGTQSAPPRRRKREYRTKTDFVLIHLKRHSFVELSRLAERLVDECPGVAQDLIRQVRDAKMRRVLRDDPSIDYPDTQESEPQE